LYRSREVKPIFKGHGGVVWFLGDKSATNLSFSKKDRLLKRSEFVRLSSCGQKRVNKHFVLFYAQGLTHKSRLGVTVSKKVGCAVIRNRVKRLCREYFRRNRHRFIESRDMSLIARKSTAGLLSDQTGNSLKTLFNGL
jgi:ribonuclease P protein component